MNESLATLAFGMALASPASAAEQETKYAVLLIDADYTLDDAYDAEKNPYGFWNLEEELQNMAEVLAAANAQHIPVFEIEWVPLKVSSPLSTQPLCYYFTAPRDDVADYFRRYGGGLEHLQPCETNSLLAHLRTSQWVQIYKQVGDSFQGTPSLQEKLQEQDITDLILMGQGEFDCVRATADTALSLGYTLHTSFDVLQQMLGPDDTHTGIAALRRFYQTKTDLAPTYKELPVFSQNTAAY